jgi:organic radical activating enzyme
MNLSNKSFIVLTHDNVVRHSDTDQLIKLNLIQFKTWYCEVFDHTKNINSQTRTTGFTACKNKSRICAISNCTCPTDIDLPKAQSKKDLQTLRDIINSDPHLQATSYDPERDGSIKAVGLYSLLKNKKFVVDWNLLRRCNFSCTYCAPDIHDYDSEFPSMEQLQQEFNDIIVPDNRAVHFNLNGGEPTIHPDIMDILKMCHSKGTVEMLSNGTASVSKYNDILDYAKVNISLHHELINEKHMEKFIQIAKLNKGELIFKYFNTFDEERFAHFLHTLNTFPHVNLVTNKRLIQRRSGSSKNRIFQT